MRNVYRSKASLGTPWSLSKQNLESLAASVLPLDSYIDGIASLIGRSPSEGSHRTQSSSLGLHFFHSLLRLSRRTPSMGAAESESLSRSESTNRYHPEPLTDSSDAARARFAPSQSLLKMLTLRLFGRESSYSRPHLLSPKTPSACLLSNQYYCQDPKPPITQGNESLAQGNESSEQKNTTPIAQGEAACTQDQKTPCTQGQKDPVRNIRIFQAEHTYISLGTYVYSNRNIRSFCTKHTYLPQAPFPHTIQIEHI